MLEKIGSEMSSSTVFSSFAFMLLTYAYLLHECTCSMASVVEKLVDDQSECDDSSDDDSSNVFEYGK